MFKLPFKEDGGRTLNLKKQFLKILSDKKLDNEISFENFSHPFSNLKLEISAFAQIFISQYH